jgi:hypothetical protein
VAKKKLIVIWPYRFRDFDWQRFELEYLSQHVEVHVHELIDALTPEFSAAYANQSEHPSVKRFSSLKEWRREFKKISKDAVIFSHVKPTSLKSALVCFMTRRSGADLIGFSTGGVPNYASAGLVKDVRYQKALRSVFHFLRRNLLAFFAPREILVGGSEEEYRARRDFPKGVLIIAGNSSDFSQALVKKSEMNRENVSVFLDTGFPGFLRDELLTGSKEEVEPKQWYPNLLKLFDQIDRALGIQTIIAIHPKHVGRDHSPLFGDRLTIGGQTPEMVAKCSLVIATNSTSISYAIAFEKPLILVTCDAIEKSKQRKKLEIRNCGIETGAKIFNIDREYTEQELRDALVIDHAKRESYKRKYLTSRTDGKPNYQVLLDEVINAVD